MSKNEPPNGEDMHVRGRVYQNFSDMTEIVSVNRNNQTLKVCKQENEERCNVPVVQNKRLEPLNNFSPSEADLPSFLGIRNTG